MSKYDLKLEGNAFQNFMLQHAEKVLLAIGIALAAFFVWSGSQIPVFKATTPDLLLSDAKRAEQHIHSPTSWEMIKDFRQGVKDADDRIAQLQTAVETADYKLGYTRGTPAKPAGLRLDPQLVAAEDLEVRTFRAPLIIRFENPEINKLRLAGAKDEGESSGFQIGGDNQQRNRPRDREVKIDAGEAVPPTQLLESPGVRPKTTSLGGEFNPYVKDFVVVTGVVPIREQYQHYVDAFSYAQGYFPSEDRPVYSKLEIQRRVEGGDWETLSEDQVRPRFLPDRWAPEVVDPAYFDPVLTGRIPLVALADYRPWMVHSKVPLRRNVPKSIQQELRGVTGQRRVVIDPFGRGASATEGQTESSGDEAVEDLESYKGDNPAAYERAVKALRPKADYRLIRFVDVDPPMGKPVQYRVRLWLADPNQRDNPMLAASRSAAEERRDGSGFQVGGSTGGASAGLSDDSGSRSQAGTAPDPDEIEASRYQRVTISPNMLHPDVRRRLLEEMNQTDRVPGARPTEWSEPSSWILAGSNGSSFYAGDAVVEGMRTTRVGETVIALTEPIARFVAGAWSEKYNTLLPSKRDVSRGDLLNFIAERIHMLNPRDYRVLRADNEPIQTNGVVVDIMGGMSLPYTVPMRYQAPTDVLVLDASGNLRVQNSLDDYKGYRHALFLEDEKAEYGKPRPSRETTAGQ